MRNVPRPVILGGLVIAFALTAASFPAPARSAPEGQITLMQTLAEWQYPGVEMPNGASMSDGGNPAVQSIKCAAVLTTPDPIEKVIAFYADKFKQAEPGAPKAEGKSVTIQDDSKGRPITLRVFVVNKADTSTTLVISRAQGEEKTHIAWSHYIRLGGVK